MVLFASVALQSRCHRIVWNQWIPTARDIQVPSIFGRKCAGPIAAVGWFESSTMLTWTQRHQNQITNYPRRTTKGSRLHRECIEERRRIRWGRSCACRTIFRFEPERSGCMGATTELSLQFRFIGEIRSECRPNSVQSKCMRSMRYQCHSKMLQLRRGVLLHERVSGEKLAAPQNNLSEEEITIETKIKTNNDRLRFSFNSQINIEPICTKVFAFARLPLLWAKQIKFQI